jgi:hypothetical protein
MTEMHRISVTASAASISGSELRIEVMGGAGEDLTRGFGTMDGLLAECAALSAALVGSDQPPLATQAVLENIADRSIVAWLGDGPANQQSELATSQLSNAVVACVKILSVESKDVGLRDVTAGLLPVVSVLRRLRDILATLGASDQVVFSASDCEVRLTRAGLKSERALIQSVADFEILNKGVELMLVVRRPDDVGQDRWIVVHEGERTRMKIDDREWLTEYHARRANPRSGDLLRVKASDLRFYLRDGTVIHREVRATSVLDLMDPMAERASAPPMRELVPAGPPKTERVEYAQSEDQEQSGGWKSF